MLLKNPLMIFGLLFSLTIQAQEVPTDAADVRPVLPGSTIPELTLKNLDGTVKTVTAENIQKPIAVTFYRGGWCPYCNKALADMRNAEKELIELGYDVWFISPDQPSKLKSTLKDPDTKYTLLSDDDMSTSRALGIAFKVDDATFEKYKEWGLDLEAASGQTHHQLPAPATFIIGTDGVVQFQYVNPDYKVRLAPSILLAAAQDYIMRSNKSES